MRSTLEEEYPGGAYVGRGFEVTLTRVPDKRYNLVTLCEVAPPDDFVPPKVARPQDNALAAKGAGAAKK
jgi:hypothetical protein